MVAPPAPPARGPPARAEAGLGQLTVTVHDTHWQAAQAQCYRDRNPFPKPIENVALSAK